MIDYSIITTDTISTLQPFLELGGKEIIKTIAKDAWEKIKTIFSNEDEIAVVEAFEIAPEEQLNKDRFHELLEIKLKSDEEFKVSIMELIKKIKESPNYSSIIKQNGNNNISVSGKINNSKINIGK